MPNLSIPPSGFDRQQVVLVPEHSGTTPRESNMMRTLFFMILIYSAIDEIIQPPSYPQAV